MHKFLRAAGFSEYTKRKDIQKLVKDIIVHADERNYVRGVENCILAEFDKNFAVDIGIAVCGEFDENDNFVYDYYFPYLRSNIVSTGEDVSVDRHAARESYTGICEDPKVGVSLIFYVQNMISYLKFKNSGMLPVRGTSVNMSAMSCQGNIMMPIKKTEWQKNKIKKDSVQRNRLIQAARGGDAEAIENLTLDDMDLYTNISKRIHKNDVFSIVDSYFMPFGMECDQYSVLGEILEWKKAENKLTGEHIYIMQILCNDVSLKVCINELDLFGEPAVGRRFKGNVWLQGFINYPGE